LEGLTANGVETMRYEYERVSIYVQARSGFSTKKELEKNGIEKKEPSDIGQENQEFADPIFRNAEIVLITWNDRKCNDQPPPQISKAVERVLLETVEMPIEATTLEPYEDCTGSAGLDDQGLCAVHHCALKKALVPIHYGLIMDPKEIDREKFFPNAADWFRGGCVISPDSKHQALVLQCARCLEERETRWLQFKKLIANKKRGSKK